MERAPTAQRYPGVVPTGTSWLNQDAALQI
jgi:hypothetical protein